MGLRIVLVAIILAWGASASANDKPWAVGVSADDQKLALALYREANDLFAQDEFLGALDKYRAALAKWDHPGINYNAAVCLIHLDRVLDALDHLERAMKYGPAALGPELYKEAQKNQRLLVGRVGEIHVSTKHPGVEVTLDGQPLFVGPGSQRKRVLVGNHQVVATEPSHVTETKPVVVLPGDTKMIVIELKPREAIRRMTRRWKPWKPWVVMIGGAAIAAAGVPMFFTARGKFQDFDDGVAAEFPMNNGIPSDETRAIEESAKRWRIATYSVWGVGGALAVTGFLMVLGNQTRLVAVTPDVGRDRAGASISLRW